MAAELVTYQMPALPGRAPPAQCTHQEGLAGAGKGAWSATSSGSPLASFLACLVGSLTGTLGLYTELQAQK